MLASALIAKARIVLQDSSSTRWTDAELLGWLNDGQREVVLIKRDAFTSSATKALIAGSKQTTPTDAVSLVDVTRNVSSSGVPTGNTVRLIEREFLDSRYPAWHSSSQKAAVIHYVFDQRNPKEFFVYPPNTGAGYVDIVYAKVPPEIASVSGSISLDGIYANGLINYILYRAYSKDAEFAPNQQQSIAAYGAFLQSLGLQGQNQVASVPDKEAG